MGFLENFNFDRFLFSLQYMWKGMLCIFAVIGVIILFIVGLTYVMNALKTKKGKRKVTVVAEDRSEE